MPTSPTSTARSSAGDFAPLREWLREHVHRHGRKFAPRELLRRVTGQELSAEPFLAYLRGKLDDADVLLGSAAGLNVRSTNIRSTA